MVRNAIFECYFWKVLFTGPYVNKIDCALYLDGCSFCVCFFFFFSIVKLIDACLEDDNQQTGENAFIAAGYRW